MNHSSILKCFTVLAILALTACNSNSDRPENGKAVLTNQQILDVPKLKDRAAELRNGKEWDDVQNFYAAQCATLRQSPSDLEAKIRLAECFIQEARVTGEHPHYYPAALKMLDRALSEVGNPSQLTPKTTDPYFRALSHKASVQLSLHDFAAAKTTAEKAIAVNPHNAYIVGCLVDALVELGDYPKAVEACDKMISIRPDIRSYSRVSYLRELHGDLPGAIEAMEMAVKSGLPGQEQTEWARLQLGHLLELKGDLKGAENQYLTSLSVRENYPFATAALAGLSEKKGNLAEAEKLLKEAIAVIPEVGFNIDLAKIYQKTNRSAEAAALVEDIKKMFAEDIAAGHNMSLEAGHFYLEVCKDTEKALEFANEEYARRPANVAVNQLLAAIWLEKGDKKKAAEHLKVAMSTGSKDPEILALKKRI